MLKASRRRYKLYLRRQATLVGGPAAGVADGSARSVQSLWHERVTCQKHTSQTSPNQQHFNNHNASITSPVLTLLLLCSIRITAVKFEHIHLPVGEGLSIYLDLVQRGAGVAPAGVCTHVPVDPQLEAPVVHVARQFMDASWEPEEERGQKYDFFVYSIFTQVVKVWVWKARVHHSSLPPSRDLIFMLMLHIIVRTQNTTKVTDSCVFIVIWLHDCHTATFLLTWRLRQQLCVRVGVSTAPLPFRVSLQTPLRISLHGGPAVVYVHVDVSELPPAVLCEPVSHVDEQILTGRRRTEMSH